MINKRVEVYFNLHKKCYSVRDKKSRLVIAHLDSIALKDVVFKVSEKGRQRVLKEKRKNVHAVIEGTICCPVEIEALSTKVTYNPYKYKSFVVLDRVGLQLPVFERRYTSMTINNKIPSIRI